MRPWYFADTWYFLAQLDRHDRAHAAARRLDRVLAGAAGVVTHDYVLAEVLAHFSDDGPGSRAAAVQLTRRMVERRISVAGDRPLFLRALDLYERRRDKDYSLTDCMSMVVMRERGISHVLTNDHHFAQEGFTVLSDAP